MKLDKNGFVYNIIFMFCTTFVFVLPLTLINLATKPMVDEYWSVAKSIAILRTLGLPADRANTAAATEGYLKLQKFSKNTDGSLKPVSNAEIQAAEKAGQPLSPIYFQTEVAGEKRYAGTFTGLGLWSSITLAIGVNHDLSQLTGLQVLVQAETPGLGGRIIEIWFSEQFSGKSVADPQKGLQFVNSSSPQAKTSPLVDGIAGATLTTNGVRDILGQALPELQALVKQLGGQS